MEQLGRIGLGMGLGVALVATIASCAQGTTDSIGDDGSGGGFTGSGGSASITTGSPTGSTTTGNGVTTGNGSTGNGSTTSTTTNGATTTAGSTTSSSSGGGCDPSLEFDCGDGSCAFILFICDGTPDCNNGADEDASLCGSSGSGAPAGWNCDPSYYGDLDCDCGCGVLDSDCADSTTASCAFCLDPGSCNTGSSCPGNIDPNDNAHCI